MTDKEMIRQIQKGRKELLNDIIEKYYNDILHFCIYQIKNTDASYDIAQETFLWFIRYVETYEYRNLKAYLITIARNLCMDYWRRTPEMEAMDEAEPIKEGREVARPEDAALNQIENQMILTELLSRLPAEQREVIIMRYYSDLKLSDISRILDVNLSTVKSRLRLGIKNMKKEWME